MLSENFNKTNHEDMIVTYPEYAEYVAKAPSLDGIAALHLARRAWQNVEDPWLYARSVEASNAAIRLGDFAFEEEGMDVLLMRNAEAGFVDVFLTTAENAFIAKHLHVPVRDIKEAVQGLITKMLMFGSSSIAYKEFYYTNLPYMVLHERSEDVTPEGYRALGVIASMMVPHDVLVAGQRACRERSTQLKGAASEHLEFTFRNLAGEPNVFEYLRD